MVAHVTVKRSKHVQDAETRVTLQQTALAPTRRAEHVENSVIWQVRVDLLGLHGQGKGGKGAGAVKTSWKCGESGHMSSQCPKKKVRALEELPHSESSR